MLPFVNLSGDPGKDYVADVITVELTANLSRIAGSFVIARSTAFTYKGKPIDVRQLGRDLGVRYALEGSIGPILVRPGGKQAMRKRTKLPRLIFLDGRPCDRDRPRINIVWWTRATAPAS